MKKKSVKKKPIPKTKSKKATPVKKKKKVSAIPKGYHSITPYLIVDHAVRAIEFYKKAFGAKELIRMEHPEGKIKHAELKIGDAKIMLADECLEKEACSPRAFGGCAVSIHLYIKDVDDVVKGAVAAGAKLLRPAEDMFYGDRCAALEDPFGHRWHVATHIEDISVAKMKKRAAALFKEKSEVS